MFDEIIKKSTAEFTAMFKNERKRISKCTVWRVKRLEGLGLNSCVALRKSLISDANWRQKGLECKDCKKVMWSDESRFTQFKTDGHIRGRRKADKVMHPSCLVPTVQAWWVSWSGLSSATLCAQNIRSADYLNILNEKASLKRFLSSLMARHIPRDCWACLWNLMLLFWY